MIKRYGQARQKYEFGVPATGDNKTQRNPGDARNVQYFVPWGKYAAGSHGARISKVVNQPVSPSVLYHFD